MRIPFPERVPIDRVAIFAIALFIIQQLEGTTLFFSAGCAAFILIAAFAFNAAGGLTRAPGAYVFFYSVLVVIVGISYKAWLGEPAQSNLLDPHRTIEVYVGTISAMLATVIISRRFSRRTGLLQNLLKEPEMYRASIGCLIFGAGAGSAIALLGESGEQLQSAFGQLNQLIPLGIIIGVMYEIRRSGGTRSVNLPILLGAGYFFFLGILDFSKQGMLTPLVCWLFPVCALQYRLSKGQIASCLLGAFIIFHYLVPYAQYGRDQVEDAQTFGQRVALSARLLEHPEQTRRTYQATEAAAPAGLNSYYSTPQGFWERLQMVSADDALINITDQGHVFGLSPIELNLLNTIPHFIWPNKPKFNIGNLYMHEITGIPAYEDTSIGIAFSPTSEAYHMARWAGVFVVAPLVWMVLFLVFDSLLGDVRATPWGLLAVIMTSHFAPEGGISGLIYIMTFGTEALVFCALFAAFAAPIFATIGLGPDRRRTQHSVSWRSALEPPAR